MRGFLNEIKNVAINRATNRINNVISGALGGGRGVGLPPNAGRVRPTSQFANLDNPFSGQSVVYPEDLGSDDQGHYILFEINEQKNANVKFGTGGKKVKVPSSDFSDFAESNKIKEQYGGGYTSGDFVNSETQSKLDSRASTVSVKGPGTRRLLSNIALYMPAQVQVSTGAQYGEKELGAFTAQAVEAVKGISEGNIEKIKNSVTNSGESGTMMAEATVTKIIDVIPGLGGIGAAMDIKRGFVRNNRLEMLFEGIGRREFTFSFKMMPKSEAEAKSVRTICEMFRFYMSPSFIGDIGTSRTMAFPATFDIKYLYAFGKENRFLNKISTCVCTQANITYGGERVQFFRPTVDGAPPVETQLDLTFKELELITRERIGEGF